MKALHRIWLIRISVFAICVLLLQLVTHAFVQNLSNIILEFSDMQDIANILSQFKTAAINPPWMVAVAFAFISCFLLVRKMNRHAVYYMVAVFMFLFLFVFSFLLSVYFTEVNQISISQIIKVLYPIFKNGMLEGIM